VTEKIPILVGITGKRALAGQEASIRARLKATFDRLDKELPSAARVLLSGLAIGADTIAAQLALERDNWLVAAVLPLPLPLYLEDFDEAGKAALSALLANPKVKLRVLATLADPKTGLPCSDADLQRRGCGGNTLRTQHYEQLGLWLADTATVLIAVQPVGETPDRLGGTARVVDYRLTGSPDVAAREVMQASRELCLPPPLDGPRGGGVWRINLPPPGRPVAKSRRPLTILLPGETRRRPSFRHDLVASFAAARGIDGLARRTISGDAARFAWPQAVPDPVATLGAIRHGISAIAMRDKTRVVRSVQLLAALFCLAVFAFGLADHSSTAMIPYLAAVSAAVFVHGLAGWRRRQSVAEDYRSVDEVLRVQRAWWNAGLSDP